MEFKSVHTNHKGVVHDITYADVDDVNKIRDLKVTGLRAFCFCGDKLVIVHEKEGHWSVPGGGVEEGESIEETVVREVREESNMKVLKQQCLGYVTAFWKEGPENYTFSACIVEPIGEFVSDPGQEVMEIKLIDVAEAGTYLQLDDVLSHCLELAIEFKKKAQS